MKHNILLLFSVLVYAQLFSQKNNLDVTQIIRFSKGVNQNKQLTKIELDGDDFLDEAPDGGASLTGYFDHNTLLKIRRWIGLSYGSLQIDYYFRRDTLIFASVTERHFGTIRDSIDFKRTLPVLEARYYFNQGSIFSREMKGSGFWNKDEEKTLLPDSRSYLCMLIKRKTHVHPIN